MSGYIPGSPGTPGGGSGANRKVTIWQDKKGEKIHSIQWMIDHAVTEEMLVDVAKFATHQPQASKKTRRRWADAIERRMFILRARPPTYEKLGLNGSVAGDPNPGPGAIPAEKMPVVPEPMDFLRMEDPDKPRVADPRAGLDVPRELWAPLPTINKADPKYKDALSINFMAASRITEIVEISRRYFNGQDIKVENYDKRLMQDCTHWEVHFMAGEENITALVLKDTLADKTEDGPISSPYSRGAALFQSNFCQPVFDWKCGIERRFGITITYRKLTEIASKPTIEV